MVMIKVLIFTGLRNAELARVRLQDKVLSSSKGRHGTSAIVPPPHVIRLWLPDSIRLRLTRSYPSSFTR
jgi:hypothetical protein